MSMFFCQRCDSLKDSDDGCMEGPGFSLICSDCMDDEDDDAPSPEFRAFTAEQQRIIDRIEAEDDGEGP